MAPAPNLLQPDWPVAAGVRACCSLRQGGVSAPPYESLNLGDHVGDAPERVAENRRRFARTVGARPVFLRQVHGTEVVILHDETPDGVQADGCVTTARGVACTIMVADCLPVLFADTQGQAVAAAHAGWRGLAGGGAGQPGIVEATFHAFAAALRLPLQDAAARTVVWLGPCIGPSAFEVGAEVRAQFIAADAASDSGFVPQASGKFLADLSGLARRRLHALGIHALSGNDGSDAWCTVRQPSRFFSHRRDRLSGRFAAAVWLD